MEKKRRKPKIRPGIAGRTEILEAVAMALMAAFVLWSASGKWEDGAPGLAASAALAAAGVALKAVVVLGKPKAVRIAHAAASFAYSLGIPFLAVVFLQWYTKDPFGEKGIYPKMLAVNFAIAAAVFLIADFAAGSFRIGHSIATAVFAVIGAANHFVVLFRGSPILPWDLMSVRTAATVAGDYAYEVDGRFAFALCGFVFLYGLSGKLGFRIWNRAARAIPAIVLSGLLAFGVVRLWEPETKAALGMDTTLFTPDVCYRNNGFLAAFLGNLNLMKPEKPDGYSEAAVAEIEGSSTTTAASPDLPDVVVIMDEAFADLSALGEFATSEEVLPVTDSLVENGMGGRLLVSVKGGNTANTEYEFLTGCSTAFLPEGSIPYQQFIKKETPSIASYLKGLGYSTTAIHPYYASGWNRDKAYPLLGFDSFLSKSSGDFDGAETLRDYVDDRAAFSKALDVLEATEGPSFVFDVTMQNHGGYSKESADGYVGDVKLTESGRTDLQARSAEKYLSLTRETDAAFGEFLAELEKRDRETIVVFFGDHQPSDYVTGVIDSLTGRDAESGDPAEVRKAYEVPYVVWNNKGKKYDLPEETSPNLLGAIVLSQCGTGAPAWSNWLAELSETLPALGTKASLMADGTWMLPNAVEGTALEKMEEWRKLSYCALEDAGGNDPEFFGLPAKTE